MVPTPFPSARVRVQPEHFGKVGHGNHVITLAGGKRTFEFPTGRNQPLRQVVERRGTRESFSAKLCYVSDFDRGRIANRYLTCISVDFNTWSTWSGHEIPHSPIRLPMAKFPPDGTSSTEVTA